MDENDLWIAATALVLDATLVTRDTDFIGTTVWQFLRFHKA
ncbi:MAG: PIN domain-containing protein [Bryobacteraceae bacterium]